MKLPAVPATKPVLLALVKAGGPPMLVNLARDLGETQDLSTKEPAKFAEMKALLEKIRAGAP